MFNCSLSENRIYKKKKGRYHILQAETKLCVTVDFMETVHVLYDIRVAEHKSFRTLPTGRSNYVAAFR